MGEEALLRGEPLPVTAVAAGPAVLLSVPRDAFLRAMAPHVAERRAAAAVFLAAHVAAFRGQPAEVTPSLSQSRAGNVPCVEQLHIL